MSGFRDMAHTLRNPGWPDCFSQSVTLTAALRLVRAYGDRVPTVAHLQNDFGVSRATAYRWRAAFAESLQMRVAADELCDEFQAAMQRGIPPIGTPDPIAADESEHGLCALPELTAEQMAEGDLTEIRR